MKWYFKCLKQYADFRGRARRSEYWYFALFNGIISFLLTFLGRGAIMVSYVYALAVFIPSLAVCVRRLHDLGKNGWSYLIVLIPVFGWIWIIIQFCTDSQPGENQWGINPKDNN